MKRLLTLLLVFYSFFAQAQFGPSVRYAPTYTGSSGVVGVVDTATLKLYKIAVSSLGGGGGGANNYTTSASFLNNTFTLNRNGLSAITATVPLKDSADILRALLAAHAANTSNPHAVTASQVGLGNVENTALSTWTGSSNISTVGTITNNFNVSKFQGSSGVTTTAATVTLSAAIGTPGSNNYTGLRGISQYTNTNSASYLNGQVIGVRGDAQVMNVGKVNQAMGVYGMAEYAGTNASSTNNMSIYAGFYQAKNSGTGAAGHLIGSKFEQNINNGTARGSWGVYIANAIPTGNGTVQQNTALHIEGFGPHNAISFAGDTTTAKDSARILIYSIRHDSLAIKAAGGVWIDSSTTYLKTLELNGTGNTGYALFPPQTTTMTAPVSGFKLYDSAGLTELRQDGFRRTISFQGLTSNVKYFYPVGTPIDTTVTRTAPQTLTNKAIDGATNIITGITNTSLSSGIDASKITVGTLPVAQTAALTGDVTKAAGSSVTTVANVPAAAANVSGIVRKIFASNTGVTNTGSTTENIVLTFTIPANTMLANGSIKADLLESFSGTAGTKTTRIYFNDGIHANTAWTSSGAIGSTITGLNHTYEIRNRNSQTSQVWAATGSGISQGAPQSSSSATFITFNFDTTQPITCTVTIQNSSAADTAKIEGIEFFVSN